METRLLTPTEMWEGYNPVKEDLEMSIVAVHEKDHISTVDFYFTSEKTEDGRVRLLARLSYDSRWLDPRPAVIILPSLNPDRTFDDITLSLINEGYVVLVCDYAGNIGGEESTASYPESLSYAQAPECFDKLNYIGSTARETSWFHWTKAARRAITALSELKRVDTTRIAIMGIDCGAQIAWQVAGIDGRIHALIPINGGGFLWKKDSSSKCNNPFLDDDQIRAFSAGVGAETYAKLVSCSVCYIVSSNSADANVDRAGDIMSLVSSKYKSLMIVKDSSTQISISVYKNLIKWLKTYFAHDADPLSSPTAMFKSDENVLYLHIKTDVPKKYVTAYYSTGDIAPFARNWRSLQEGQETDSEGLVFQIPVADPDNLVAAYACVCAPSGISSCTPVLTIKPSSLGVVANIAASSSRIIYSSNMGLGLFKVSTNGFITDDSLLSLKKGPFDISGVSTSEGILSITLDNADKYATDKHAIIQMDVFSETAKQITFSFLSALDSPPYSCSVNLNGGNFWQKVKLVAPDIKSSVGKTLSSFSASCVLLISNAENAVFNNLIWI